MNASQPPSDHVVKPAGIRTANVDLLDRGWYISYMNYYATGEGVTTCVAIGGSHEKAEDVIRERIDKYFHGGIKTELIGQEMGEDAGEALARVPIAAIDALLRIPPGTGHFFSELHFNLG